MSTKEEAEPTGSEDTQITDYESAGNLEATAPLACIPATEVENTNSAADVAAGAKACADAGQYDQAAELIMVASAYAFYDTQRVADETAHGALSAVFTEQFGSLPEAERSQLFDNIDTLDSDAARKGEICEYLRASEPPTYMPTYMIAHGMGAFTGESQEPLVEDFDAAGSWEKALEFVNCDRSSSP